jgi:transposase
VQRLFELWERELPRISGKSKFAESLRYARAHRAALSLFLDDGRVKHATEPMSCAPRPRIRLSSGYRALQGELANSR